MGRGVFTSQRIKHHEAIMRLPLNKVLSGDRNSPRFQQDKGLQQVFANIHDEGHIVAMMLVYERYRGEDSDLAAWVRVLPKRFYGTRTWTSAELEKLEDPEATRRARMNREELEKAYRHMVREVWPKLVKHNPSVLGKKKFTLKVWSWACGAVDTRAWNMRGHKYLVPGADMFNHDLDKEDEQFDFSTYNPYMRSQKFLTYHKVTSTYVEVYSDRTCDAQKELHESYGDNSNDIYLDYHGFVPDWNPYHCIQLGSGKCVHFGEKLTSRQQAADARAKLSRFSTSEKQDGEMIASGKVQGNERTAVLYRRLIKRILQKSLELS
eukprot:PhF_6_TR22699/c0_g1_i1/m.32325